MFCHSVSRWTLQLLPQETKWPEVQTLPVCSPDLLQLLRTCSSDGAPKEFVDSSPTSVRGRGAGRMWSSQSQGKTAICLLGCPKSEPPFVGIPRGSRRQAPLTTADRWDGHTLSSVPAGAKMLNLTTTGQKPPLQILNLNAGVPARRAPV